MANARARQLRQAMTPQEVKLWVHLRSWRSRGCHFRRQSPRNGYIVDFVCLRHRLVIEVDGGQHNFDAHAVKDRKRDAHFEREGFTVLRFWNNEIDKNLRGVLDVIDQHLADQSPHPAGLRPATLPLRGRDNPP
jgi:very-short-patch-repair endonuclease